MVDHKRRSGFTLVELLIVIAIVSILMVLGATNWITQQKKARDAKNDATVSVVQTALEMYRTDKGYYPAAGSNSSCNPDHYWSTNQVPALALLVSEGYLKEYPWGPNGGPNLQYHDMACGNAVYHEESLSLKRVDYLKEGQVYILEANFPTRTNLNASSLPNKFYFTNP